jgi:hypothetical protein
VNDFLSSSQYCNPSFHSVTYPVQPAISLQLSQPAITVYPAQQSISVQAHPVSTVQCTRQEINLSPLPNSRTAGIQNNIQTSIHTVPHQLNIQQLPDVPNLVAASGRERISAKLNKVEKDSALLTLAKLTDDKLSEGDEHGDT